MRCFRGTMQASEPNESKAPFCPDLFGKATSEGSQTETEVSEVHHISMFGF